MYAFSKTNIAALELCFAWDIKNKKVQYPYVSYLSQHILLFWSTHMKMLKMIRFPLSQVTQQRCE